MRQDQNGGLMLSSELLRLRLQRRAFVLLPRQHREHTFAQQILIAIPALKAEKHIRPQQENKLPVRVLLTQSRHGVRAVAAP